MDYKLSFPQYQPVMFAQSCPEEPIIMKDQESYEKEPSTQQTPKSKSLKNAHSHISYRPRIITSKWAQTSARGFQQIQHERQLFILQKRIKNCKSLIQRKKDHNDPIVYPAYFIRDKKRCQDARIDGFFKRIVEGSNSNDKKLSDNKQKKRQRHGQNNRKSRIIAKQEYIQEMYDFYPQSQQKKFMRSNFPLPPVAAYHQAPKRDEFAGFNLPSCDAASIISFITQRKMYLESDLKILKARLIHYHGKAVERCWQEALHYLLHHKPT